MRRKTYTVRCGGWIVKRFDAHRFCLRFVEGRVVVVNVSANAIADHRTYQGIGWKMVVSCDSGDGHARRQTVECNMQPRMARRLLNHHTCKGPGGGRMAGGKGAAESIDVAV